MHRIGNTMTLLILVLAVCLISYGALSPFQKTLGGTPLQSYFPMQETASYEGSVVKTYLAGAPTAWAVVNRSDSTTYAKGFRVIGASAGGNIVVHLVDNPAGAYDTYDFAGGDKEGVIFDTLIAAGTTIDLDDVKILL